MKSRSNTTRLYMSTDIYNELVWFARNEVEQFARVKKTEFGWYVWFYPYHFGVYTKTLTRCLEITNNQFKKYWKKKYA